MVYHYDTPTTKDLITIVTHTVGVDVSYSTTWRGERRAANEVWGSLEDNFSMIYSYMYMLQWKNPGTIIYVELDAAKDLSIYFDIGGFHRRVCSDEESYHCGWNTS